MTLSASEYANQEDNALFQAIKAKEWQKVEQLLTEDPQLALERDEFDNTPLHSAIGFQCPAPLLLKLLDAIPKACQTHGTDEWLPLHVAAMWGTPREVMEALILQYPAALDDRGQESVKGKSPRHFSGRFAHNRDLLERPTEEWERIKAERENVDEKES